MSQLEREILELPVRFGGLGIINPSTMSQREYQFSRKITESLVSLIKSRTNALEDLDRGEITKKKLQLQKEKEVFLEERHSHLKEQADEKLQNHIDQAKEKGASAWLTALPLSNLNYTLNKREFHDSIALRYGWTIKDIPNFCGCGNKNSIYHSLDCKKGGYVSMRHNAVRDTFAYLLREAKCKDVRVEPSLLPVDPANFSQNTNVQEDARLDISAVGVFAPFERTFFDIRVTHPNCDTNAFKTLNKVYKEHETAKKAAYEERVLQAEKGSFVPLVFTTSGGMGPLCSGFVNRISELIALDRNESVSEVKGHIRTRLRFALLRSTLVSLRGIRGYPGRHGRYISLNEVSFNLIPKKKEYEMP